MVHYQHRQRGRAVIVWILAMTPLILAVLAYADQMVMLVPAAAIMLVSIVLFYALTVTIDERAITLSFGIGLVRRKIALADVSSCEIATCRWYYGYGIHYTPQGKLYNISGKLAVRLALRSGKAILVGTDEPDALCRALRQAANIPEAGKRPR